MIRHSLTDNTVTFFGRDLVSRTIASDHANFDAIRSLLISGSDDYASLEQLSNVRAAAVAFGVGRVEIKGETVYFDGAPLHNALTARMLQIMRAGGSVAPLSNFLVKLNSNPSNQAVSELYLWIEGSKLPIDEDGDIIAYKRVRDDYRDYYTGSFDNSVGQVVEMPRNKVDDRRERTCSHGLHFCSFDYLPHYYGSSGRIVVVKINPADVVSIPHDYNNAKGRTARYEVVGEVTETDYRTYFTGKPVTNYSAPPAKTDATEDAVAEALDDETLLDTVSFRDLYDDEYTLRELVEALKDSDGVKRAAARDLGVAESTLRGWLKRYEDVVARLVD